MTSQRASGLTKVAQTDLHQEGAHQLHQGMLPILEEEVLQRTQQRVEAAAEVLKQADSARDQVPEEDQPARKRVTSTLIAGGGVTNLTRRITTGTGAIRGRAVTGTPRLLSPPRLQSLPSLQAARIRSSA